jgi:hypothetical protein
MLRAWLTAALGLFSFPGGMGALASPTKLKTRLRRSNWFISYSRPIFQGFDIWSIITPDQGCLLGVTGPVQHTVLPNRSEIGTYHYSCSEEEAAAVRGLIGSALTEAAATDGMAYTPGTRFLSFGLGTHGEDRLDQSSSFALSQSLPPGLAKFDAAVMALARKTMDHPIMVLRASASVEALALGPDADVRAVLRLTNVGTAPVRVRNPAALEAPGFSLILKDSKDEVTFIEAKQGEVTQLDDDGKPRPAKASQLLRLKPTETLGLAIRIRRPLSSHKGPYRGEVRFTSDPQGIPETEAIVGFVQTAAGTLHISSAGKTP